MKTLSTIDEVQNSGEGQESAEQATRMPYMLWCIGGLLETVALVAGFYWILNNPDSRWLVWRVIGVAALAMAGGGLSLAGAAIASKKGSAMPMPPAPRSRCLRLIN